MAFTDRFLRIPIEVYDTKTKEITGEEITEESWEMINPLDISSYRPSYPEDDKEKEGTNIVMKNGEKAFVLMTITDFEKVINKFMDER